MKHDTTPTIDAWAAYMRFTGSAETTITTRTRVLRRLNAEVGDTLTLGKTELIGWLAAYDLPSTRSTVLSYLRAYYRWALREDLLEADPTTRIPTVKVPNGKPRPADVDVIAAALANATPRTRNMMLLMAYAGFRCCEVAAFRPEHVEHRGTGWWVHIPRGKGGSPGDVPLPAEIAATLAAAEPWDVGVQSVQKTVSRALGDAATPHMLRHYYATSALRSTQNLRRVQEMMRHASPATTARYAAVTSEELTHASESLPRIA